MRKHPKAYYHYGEGAIGHSPDRPCKLMPGIHHPAIHRTEYPSIWHYRWSRVCEWVWDRGRFTRFIRLNDDEATFDWGLWGIGGWLFNQAHPRYPHIFVEFDPKDSIYDDDWAKRDARTRKMWADHGLDPQDAKTLE